MALVAVFPIIVVVALVGLAMLVGLIALIAHPKTRVAGVVLAVILLLLAGSGAVLGLAAVFWVRGRPVEVHHGMTTIEQQGMIEYQRAAAEHRELPTANRILSELGEHMTGAPPHPAGPPEPPPGPPEPLPADVLQPGATADASQGTESAGELPPADVSPNEPSQPDGAAAAAADEEPPNDETLGSAAPPAEPADGSQRDGDASSSVAAPSTVGSASDGTNSTPPEPEAMVAGVADGATAAAESPAAGGGAPSPAKPQAQEPKTLTEPPAPAAKPAWVGRPAHRGELGYEMSLTVGPFTSAIECESNVSAAVATAADQYVEAYLGQGWSRRVRLGADVLRNQVVDRWEETIQASFGPMIQWHLLVRFDDRFNALLREAKRRALVGERLWLVGVSGTAVLALLSLAYVGLRIKGVGSL